MKQVRVAFPVVFILLCLGATFPEMAVALGKAAKSLIQPTHYITRLIHTICLATGTGLIISAIVKYMDYRRHHHIRFSVIFFLLLTGLALIGVGFLPMPTAKY